MKLYKTSCNFIHTNLGFFKLMETIETFTFFFFPSFFLSFFLSLFLSFFFMNIDVSYFVELKF